MRIVGANRIIVPGWMGGVVESLEPGSWDPREGGMLERGFNLVPSVGNKLAVRGGSAIQRLFLSNAISQVLLVEPWSPTGMVVITYSATADKHYAYALTDEGAWALPNGAGTELGSRCELGSGWATVTAGKPVAVELFEKLFVFDASDTNRRTQVALQLSGGALALIETNYDMDGTGGNNAPMKPYTGAVYSSHLFTFGYESESAGLEPAMGRHSLLGTDPSAASGFDRDGYNIFGAIGQPCRAAAPGNTILLMAKESELYRISGSGRGLPGWQFPFEPLDNTEGLGCSHAHALAHMEGTWYGSGRGGPFLTNGVAVTSIRPPRLRSWANVDELSVAFVKPHPERRLMLFGYHVTGSPSRPAVPFELWAWDIDRETWMPTHRYPYSFHMVRAIAAGASPGPSDVPSEPEQMFVWGQFEFDAASGTFNAGDLTAQTEVWFRQVDGPTVLKTTLPAGIQRFRVSADTSRLAFIKLRHVKGIAIGEFTGEVPVYTRIQAPEVKVGTPVNDGLVRADYRTFVPHTDLLTFDSGGGEVTYPDRPAGFTTEFDLSNDACFTFIAPDLGALYSAISRKNDWPLGFEESAEVECHTLAHKCCGAIATLAPEPRQRLERGGMALDAIAVLYFPARQSTSFRVDYRLAGVGRWTAGPVTTSGTALDMQEVALTGLVASSRYEVSVVNVTSAVRSATVIMFTKLAPPSAFSATTLGSPGTPLVNLLVTPFVSGKDLQLYNALGTYDAAYAYVGGPQGYQSTVGVCGAADRYFARTYDSAWPEAWQYSDAMTVDIADPCL